MSDWQPIETAPKETIVLVFDPDEGVVTGSLWFSEWALDPGTRADLLHPTHWMPLPAPPTT